MKPWVDDYIRCKSMSGQILEAQEALCLQQLRSADPSNLVVMANINSSFKKCMEKAKESVAKGVEESG